jgi:F-type H+-transporting ATPase subunit a
MKLDPWWHYLLFGAVAAIIALVVLALAASNAKKIPGRLQGGAELLVDGLRKLFLGALGEGGEQHLPLVMSLFVYILICNVMGQVPLLKSATSCTSVTIALGIIVFFYVQYYGIKANGIGGYLKHFVGPVIYLAPLFIVIEIVGELAKPFSLAMRLFGNIFGEDVINDLATKAGQHFLIPVQFPVYLLQLFTDTVQAFIFALLTCAYIGIMTAKHHDEGDRHDPHPHKETPAEHAKSSLAGLGGDV